MNRALVVAATVFGLAAASTAQQRTSAAGVPAARAQVPTTLRILDQRIPEVRFDEQPFEQVIEWLADFTHLNVVVRWQTLDDAGVKRDKPISIQVKNLRLSQVLWLIMNDAGGAEMRLAYRASGNLLILSTADDLGREMVTKVYDVADLLLRVSQTAQPDYSQNSQGLGQNTGGGGGQSVFGQSQTQQRQEQEGGNEVELTKLVEIIQRTVEPDTWQLNGGRGHIETFGHLLIVHNTIMVHQQLGGYLRESEVVGP